MGRGSGPRGPLGSTGSHDNAADVAVPLGLTTPGAVVFQLDNIRKARARGEPWHLIVHEDVLVFRAPGFPGSSRELGGAQRELRGLRGASPMMIPQSRVNSGRRREPV
jgi:hypothetical protein